MDEDEYRSAHAAITGRACPFEKAILQRRCDCAHSRRFNLADREGTRCASSSSQPRCSALLALLREKAQFTLGRTRSGGPLPHGQEIRVQVGGLLGLQRAMGMASEDTAGIGDIDALVDSALERFGALDALPFGDILRSVASFRARRRRR